MAKRTKRLKAGIESLKEEIEKHFKKIENDIEESNFERGRYHTKEVDRSLIKSLEDKIRILGLQTNIVDDYRKRLEIFKKKIEEEL